MKGEKKEASDKALVRDLKERISDLGLSYSGQAVTIAEDNLCKNCCLVGGGYKVGT